MRIYPVGNKAVLEGELSSLEEKTLQDMFSWCSTEDLSAVKYMYADNIMYVGKMWDVCETINEMFGKNCYVDISHNFPEREFDFQFNGTPRFKQEQLAQSAHDFRYGFIEAPAGSGKTPTAALLIAKLGVQTVFLAEEKAPFYQAYETLKYFLNEDIGLFGDGHCDIKPITVCMVQTWESKERTIRTARLLKSALNKTIKDKDVSRFRYFENAVVRKLYKKYKASTAQLIEHLEAELYKLEQKAEEGDELVSALCDAKLVIIDEAHNMGAKTYLNIIDSFTEPSHIIGFSATPFRDDDREELIYAVCGPILDSITTEEAIDNKMIVPITFVFQDGPEHDFGFTSKDGKPEAEIAGRNNQFRYVKKNYIIDNDARHQHYVDFARRCSNQGKSCAIIVTEVKHGNNIKRLVPEAVELYGDASKDERDRVWKELGDKDFHIIITTLMGEATNVPSLDAVAVAAGGKSKKDFIQRMRCSRTYPGKTEGFVYFTYDRADFVRSHSAEILKLTKEYVKHHRRNSLHFI